MNYIVRNLPSEDIDSSDRNITVIDDINATYEGINFQIPGRFRVNSIKSLERSRLVLKLCRYDLHKLAL